MRVDLTNRIVKAEDMTTPISQKRVSRHQLPAGHVAVSDKLRGGLLYQELTKCNVVLIKAQFISRI